MSVSVMTSAAALAAHLPYFHLGSIDTGVVPIQAFGILVATGVLIGASLLRRYAEWHGISDDDIRGLTAWVTASGFIGAHVFDVLAYQWDNLAVPGTAHYEGPILLIKIWSGISSYGGFIGGAAGFAFYVWWKRLPARLMADTTIIGLLPAFSIGRIGCTVVSDHIGAAVDPSAWYSALAMNYPVSENIGTVNELVRAHASWVQDGHLLAWNLGLVEFLYLVPLNALVLFLAFRSSKRPNTGLLIVLTALLYAPVRFGLDFLRPADTDPLHFGLTFAQWASIAAFGAAVYVAIKIVQKGAPAETVTKTSGEAQRKLKSILKEAAGDVALDPEAKPEAKAAPKPTSTAKKKKK
jgi:phosphatidylglycerol:prolipoprotein diacylglycerol transferase